MRTGRELGDVGLADADGARVLDAPHEQLVLVGDVLGEEGEPCVVRMPRVRWVSLNAMGMPCSGPSLTARLALVGGGGRGEGALGIQGDDRVDGGVEAFDAVEVGLDDLAGRQLTTTDARREVDGVEGAEFVLCGSVIGGAGGGGTGVGGTGGNGHGSPRAAGREARPAGDGIGDACAAPH